MASKPELLEMEDEVELWRLGHDTEPVEVFFVKDPTRTPEDWGFKTLAEARMKYEERLKNAETQPPIIQR